MTDTTPTWPFDRTCPFEPPPKFRELRENEPVAQVRLWDGSKVWLATRYDDVRGIFANPHASSDTSRPGYPQSSQAAVVAKSGQRSFIRMDPPTHDDHRAMVARDFAVKRVRGFAPFVEELADDLLDRMAQAGPPTDLVDSLAQVVPAHVTCRLMGLPVSDSAYLQERIGKWISLETPPEVGEQANRDALAYFGELIDSRIADPGEDMVSRLVRDRLVPGHLAKSELQHMLYTLLIGGYDTTANMISLSTITLLQHPDQLDELKADASLWPQAIEELLRYHSVTHLAVFRLALADLEVAGVQVHAGEGLIASVMAANHDPEKFPDPDSFDIRRDARAHVAFGYGIHQCIGQSLARLELSIVLPRLFARFPTLALPESSSDILVRNALVYGIERLPVRW
jgi:cytochrome P450